RSRQPPESLAAATLPARAARRAARGGDGSDRRLGRVAVASVPQFVGRARRPPAALGARRLALGRRAPDVHARSRALRAARPPSGGVGTPPAPRSARAGRDATAVHRQSAVRSAVVAQ